MREIKFRAWEREGESMVYGVGITPASDLSIPYKITPTEHNPEFISYYPDSTLMQYTGLKDKNGREIYEGDVVAFFHAGDTERIDVDAVEWMDVEQDGYPIGWGLFPKTFDYEVIGNIHEKPDLLEVPSC